MNNNHQVKNDNDTKKIFTTLVLVLTLMICTTSATYAYFAISATATNNVTGTAATANLQWGTGTTTNKYPSLVSPSSTYSSKPMVPQKSLGTDGTTNILQLAVTGGDPNNNDTPVPCVDDNSNVICRIYNFTICNDSTAAAKVDGTIQFNWAATDSFTNLKYLFMTNATTTGTVSSTTIKSATAAKSAAVTFEDDYLLSADTNTTAGNCAGGNKTYYLVVWIEETGANQNSTDKGTFYATISFNSSAGGGLTSTITG